MDTLEPFEALGLSIEALPEICPGFKISKLPENPPNPIMESLQFVQRLSKRPLPEIETEFHVPMVEQQHTLQQEEIKHLILPLWEGPALHAPRTTNMSWDTLYQRKTTPSSPFLSERPGYTLAAARRIVLPTYQNDLDRIINVSPVELIHCLEMTLTGISSPLHIWDPETETFSLRGVNGSEIGKLVISSLDASASESLVQRFLTIGTLTRRLEVLVSHLRDTNEKDHKHLHALGHALSSVLSSVKARISELPRPTAAGLDESGGLHVLTTVWSACSEPEQQLEDIANLCNRGLSLSPSQYPAYWRTASELLSTIYARLEGHLNNHSPRATTAVCAFLLTSVSTDIFEKICTSVGYICNSAMTSQPQQSGRTTSGLFDDDGDNGIERRVEDGIGDEDEAFPSFFTDDFGQSIIRARRSLTLLQAARADHPILADSSTRRKVQWFWSEKDVEAAWLESLSASVPTPAAAAPEDDSYLAPEDLGGSGCQTGLQVFKLFDLEPGTHWSLQSTIPSSSNSHNPFNTFLSSFPSQLPSLTPTVQILRDLVLAPLASHIDSLSSALLDVFLSGSAGYLDFRRHLTLLRSYLLITSHAFKTRLESSLLYDAPEVQSTELAAQTRARVSRALSRKRGREAPANSWVVGLAPALTEGHSWPPGGSDLNFYLRRVIIDALDADYHVWKDYDADDEDAAEDQFLQEAEWRLGFAIRDLSVGSRARWLDPRSIEALDFVYMDYHPPHPVDVLVPPSTLSKYHRVFAFNLRLLRVENVMKALFRMTLEGSNPLFETLATSQRLFLYFRFVTNSFVTGLSSYVYDTAIGANFDAFLHGLARTGDAEPRSTPLVFTDVFALADHHSQVMDDILSACLLRSGQKAVGDVLRGALEIVLEFGILMSDLRSRRMQEYEAAAPLEDLFYAFRRRMIALRKGLKEMIDKTAPTVGVASEDAYLRMQAGSLAGAAANLHDLLTRINIPDTWAP